MSQRNRINRHNYSYNKSVEHALRAIYEGVSIRVDGQVFEYDKQQNLLIIKDFCSAQYYQPKFNGSFCSPFAKKIKEPIGDKLDENQ